MSASAFISICKKKPVFPHPWLRELGLPRRAPRNGGLEQKEWPLCPDEGPVPNLDRAGFRGSGSGVMVRNPGAKSLSKTLVLFGTHEISRWSVKLLWLERQDQL